MTKFECPECTKQFDKQRGLTNHISKAHPKAKPETTTKTKATTTEPEKKTVAATTEMTPDQRAIFERAQKQDTKWFAIREDELEDFSLMENAFNLHPEAKKLQKEKTYAFRFCERTPDRIDYLTRSVEPPLRWAIVTRTSLPVMSKYIDDLWGCVCVRDQVLLFKPWAHHEMVKRAKQQLADAASASGSLAGQKQKIEAQTDGVHVDAEVARPEDSKFKIGSRDVVVADEAEVDKALGIEDDHSDLGDLVVAE